MSVWYDVHGEGPAVVLVHAGIADSRMWEPQLDSFSESHTVVRVDLPGFGHSEIETNPVSYRGAIAEALDAAGVAQATVVGTSLGGRAALEFALDAPERVSALVLVGSGIDDHEWSEQVEAYGAEEETALERGDARTCRKPERRLLGRGSPPHPGRDRSSGSRAGRRDATSCLRAVGGS